MERATRAEIPEEVADALRPVIDRELDLLPERYRRPIVLFHLEGRSLEETAEVLGRPEGTVGAWLSRGREILRDRLARKGVTALSVGLLGAFLSREASAHAVSLGFAHQAARVALGQAMSGKVLALSEAAMKILFWTKVKSAVVAMGAVGALLAVNVVLFSGGTGVSSHLPRSSALEAAVIENPGEPGAATPLSEPTGEITWNSDLLGHWTLDDDKVADASGHGAGGKIVGTVTWGEGKIGGAAIFDGKGGHIQIANSDALDKVQEGSYSVAAWFKPADVPPGKDDDNNESYGIIIKTGWHTGLQYNSAQKFTMTHWVMNGAEPEWKGAGAWDQDYPPGQWYHLVGTVDRPAGKVALYLNGELKGETEFPANAKAKDAGDQPWRIGIGSPGAEHWSWPAKGAIDDVRIYGKCLAAEEVRAIFEPAKK
jgi:hypothetical protein